MIMNIIGKFFYELLSRPRLKIKFKTKIYKFSKNNVLYSKKGN